jgi:hypothetical protein
MVLSHTIFATFIGIHLGQSYWGHLLSLTPENCFLHGLFHTLQIRLSIFETTCESNTKLKGYG